MVIVPRNIRNLSAAYSEEGKEIIKAIFGEGIKDEKLGAGIAKSFGRVAEQFNISSIQFAIHYMFENAETLT